VLRPGLRCGYQPVVVASRAPPLSGSPLLGRLEIIEWLQNRHYTIIWGEGKLRFTPATIGDPKLRPKPRLDTQSLKFCQSEYFRSPEADIPAKTIR
jgi:hypothetical protein